MPIICSFRGIRITINYKDHMPPHFHAYYGEYECCVDIKEIEKINEGIIRMDEKTKQYFENPRKLEKVNADDEFNLYLTFDNGEVRIYDMKNELNGIFSALRDKKKFQSVFIDEFGNVAWDMDDSVDSREHWENRIDICKDALYMDSKALN